ncbi:MAG TPA: aminodeoxychorismate synthase component I [Firmicutes bacterium]|nr:aminodeoxychorismate synthase component I [Bacillota bacterium]
MKRIIKELHPYRSIHEIYSRYHRERNTVFLDSSLRNSLGKYSIIGLHPYLTITNDGETLVVNGTPQDEDFETFLRRYLLEHWDENETDLPIVSGAIGYFSYDYGRKSAGISSRHRKEVEIPQCILNFYDDFIIEDHQKKKIWFVANGKLQKSCLAVEQLEREIAEIPRITEDHRAYEITVIPNFQKKDYLDAIDKMIQYIIEGDIYIANMTQQLAIRSEKVPFDAFLKLRRINPSPFGGYLQYGDFQIICASPERFLLMKQKKIETRPIKGTRKRGETPQEDAALRRELEQSEKDRSELLMIVDLERNDLNHVCVPGSVKVTELFAVEEYATVFHLVSTITGRLREELTAMDLMSAAFPGGSITGAPKIRAMEIIDELEHSQRNLYTGSIGYLTLDGSMDLNIVIRTALHKDGVYHLGVGGGITFESDLEFEYEETLQKAKAILEALT